MDDLVESVMEFAIIIAALLLITAVIYYFTRYNPKPNKRHLGPWVQGKNRTVGTKLEGNSFQIPTSPGHVHALVDPTIDLRGKSKLTCRYNVEGYGPFFAYEYPDAPGTISLMIQRKGDDFSAKGEKQWYRLYAPHVEYLTEGTHTLEVNLKNPDRWIGVWGGGVTQSQIDDVVNNLYAIHVCFSGGGPRAHGLFASTPAKFTLLELSAS